MAKQNGSAFPFRENIERRSNQPPLFFGPQQGLWPGCCIGAIFANLDGRAPLPEVVVADVDRDTVKPGTDVAIDSRAISKPFEKYFLRRVPSVLGPSEKAVCSFEDYRLMGQNDGI